MDRRGCLKCGAFAAAASAQATTAQTVATVTAAASSTNAAHSPPGRPANVPVRYTGDDHRRRLQNIASAGSTWGLPAEAPDHRLSARPVLSTTSASIPAASHGTRTSGTSGNWTALAAHGIGLIQVHEEWNDSQRLFGRHKLRRSTRPAFAASSRWSTGGA